jgi:DNA-binding PadR family transcriptional regulator
MARVAQTEVAVLAALGVQPMTGYAVREAIRDQLGHFWSESFGQIYPTLTALAERGLIEHPDPASPAWALTQPGRERMLDLLRTEIPATPPRDPLMLRLFFGAALGPEECAALVRDARERARSQLAAFGAIRQVMDAESEYAEHHPYWFITLSAGEHRARAAIAWADETLAILDGMPAD